MTSTVATPARRRTTFAPLLLLGLVGLLPATGCGAMADAAIDAAFETPSCETTCCEQPAPEVVVVEQPRCYTRERVVVVERPAPCPPRCPAPAPRPVVTARVTYNCYTDNRDRRHR